MRRKGSDLNTGLSSRPSSQNPRGAGYKIRGISPQVAVNRKALTNSIQLESNRAKLFLFSTDDIGFRPLYFQNSRTLNSLTLRFLSFWFSHKVIVVEPSELRPVVDNIKNRKEV
jgi:hypothetical protein